MPEVSDVLRRYGREYLEQFGEELLPSHRRAIEDLLACRAEAQGGTCSKVTTVAASIMSTTPAATAAVPSATTTIPKPGWKSGGRNACRCPTFMSS